MKVLIDTNVVLDLLLEREPFIESALLLFKQTDNDAVLERVDSQGNILGFSVLNVSKLLSDKPLLAQLTAQ